MKNLTKFLVRKNYNRSQMLYREGERADRVFFVIKGEFKVTKKIVLVDKKKEEHKTQVESVSNANTRPMTSAFPLAKHRDKNNPAPTRKTGVLDLIIVTTRGMLGEEDAYLEADDHKYMTSCECISKEAEVYELKQEDFLREGKRQAVWSEVVKLI